MISLKAPFKKYRLPKKYKEELQKREVVWPYGGYSETVFKRTYALKKNEWELENWADTVIRVIEGQFSILKTHKFQTDTYWDDRKADKLAVEAANRMFCFKWLPPGRSLFKMGTEYVKERGSSCLNNCTFVSTENIYKEQSQPFAFCMDMLMQGAGVGYDTKGAGQADIYHPIPDATEKMIIEDSREGWVEAVSCLIDSYLEEDSYTMDFDYSNIRPEGTPIKGFGGTSSGYMPLKQGIEGIRDILSRRASDENNYITSVDITDIMNIIAKSVIAGNVRRSAQISFSYPEDEDFISMKNWKKHPIEMGMTAPLELKEYNELVYMAYENSSSARPGIVKRYENEPWAYKFGGWRWSSNNSVFAEVGMDYTDFEKDIATNGEPGFAWLSNMQEYGRIKDGKNNKDNRVRGGNPCLEISLESYEMCNLVETFPSKHNDYWDFQRTLKFAYLFAKTVTLIPTNWQESNEVIKRNRRIGCSQSGIQEAIQKFGRRKYLDEFCDKAYDYIQYIDEKYSDWLGIPKSIKTTCVKPSGTVSILAGSLPGIHYAESESYYRTVRIASDSPILVPLREANYKIEPANSDPGRTSVVYFPILHEEDTISKHDITIWEQIQNAVDLQKYWADNQVSITVTFKSEEANQIARVLSCYDKELKGISLLPLDNHGYEQAPYISAPREEIQAYKDSLGTLDFSSIRKGSENIEGIKYCDTDYCEV